MILFKQAQSLSQYLTQLQQQGKKTGFVPTMGALHRGHLSLLEKAKQETDITVCSIFVNPTQFNNPDDFKKYPITIEKDIDLLVRNGCDVLFLPPAEEIYPSDFEATLYDLGALETVLEGFYRPGHFQGVCQVVDRLLEIVHPNSLYLGQKDYQQCQVIRRLLTLTNREDITLVTGTTIREDDGLAMSSRNLRLSEIQRSKATCLYQALVKARNEMGQKSVMQIEAEAVEALTKQGFRVDYFQIADAATLLPPTEETTAFIALVAAYLDEVRLIDNLQLN